MGKLSWSLGRASQTRMAHVSAYAVVGLLAALIASLSSRHLPWPLPLDITVDAIDSLSSIPATSMLTVTIFAIVGLVALKISAYGPQGRAVVFVVTLVVISSIALALLRLIERLTKLGQVIDTAGRIELATYDAMKYRLKHPFLGGRQLPKPQDHRSGIPILADTVGYVQFIAAGALSAICTDDEKERLTQVYGQAGAEKAVA
ncbi:DUF2254 domain-containing protein [Paracoccus sp. 11-3]|uniref:DUF2254 domain-containing protein n=1 Tax=Paracoccus amoyensis TaxID=2760093 RepID=A0A926GDB9_9RHOB|nr:DUF2254 family protein [Paracoccus amoyensis]MBC9246391.1 DUF2254 domain-containing protein [Paracoccus amoyensis]